MPIRGDRNREILAASIHRIVITAIGESLSKVCEFAAEHVSAKSVSASNDIALPALVL